MTRRVLLLLIALTAACHVSTRWGRVLEAMADEGLQALVAEGERWWTQSPDPRNPVACATCHHDPADIRGWAASFPKFKPMPPPHSRVMTLLQANTEAVTRHYRLPDPLPAATAITAYLMSQGAGLPITPGVSIGQPVFPDRMRELAESVVRGQRLYALRCGQCHDEAAVAPSVTRFPRVVDGRAESLESFLQGRQAVGPPLAWDDRAMAEVIAYLVSRVAGRPVGFETYHTAKEGP